MVIFIGPLNDCPDGYYGSECSQVCGYCLNVSHCDRVFGDCTDGCKPGYYGTMCKDGKLFY